MVQFDSALESNLVLVRRDPGSFRGQRGGKTFDGLAKCVSRDDVPFYSRPQLTKDGKLQPRKDPRRARTAQVSKQQSVLTEISCEAARGDLEGLFTHFCTDSNRLLVRVFYTIFFSPTLQIAMRRNSPGTEIFHHDNREAASSASLETFTQTLTNAHILGTQFHWSSEDSWTASLWQSEVRGETGTDFQFLD
ncbi:hypothetical protein RRG08_056094 [Elysia crispata]|uniref:Uncharacterized protein n=1 Tax=Elysia crispata TaxID=231223 RepID=A0AAE0ZC31_9GAST|nr:hypothetical protein RRG08_056094 [Elysia crispata]